jgi:hypothetical protein
LRSTAEARHPEEISQHEGIYEIARLERFDNPVAGPLVFGIEPQGLAKMFERFLVIAALQQSPPLIGVSNRIIRIL